MNHIAASHCFCELKDQKKVTRKFIALQVGALVMSESRSESPETG